MADNKQPEAEVNEEVSSAETEAPTTEGQAPESIGLQDLQVLAQIVDLASQRGAFRGNELTQVGAAFDKLSTLKIVTVKLLSLLQSGDVAVFA